MDLSALILDLRIPLVVVLAFTIAANDAAASMATAVGSGTLPLRVALVAAATAAVIPMLLLVAPTTGGVLQPFLPEDGGPAAVHAVGLAAAATVLVVLAATALGLPVPALAVMAGALAGPVLLATPQGTDLAPPLAPLAALAWLAGPALLLPAVAAVLAGLVFNRLERRVLVDPRPRDRMRRALPLLVAATLAAAAWLCVVTFAAGPGVVVWAGAPAAALVAGGIGHAVVHTMIARTPFWVTNDVDGTERSHHSLQVGGSLVLAFLQGGHQTGLVAVPVALVLLEPARSAVPAMAAMGQSGAAAWAAVALPVALGACAGILVLGQRTVRRVASGLAPLSPTRGAAANLAVLVVLAGAGTGGLPAYGGPAAAAAVAGVGAGGGGVRGRGTLAGMVLAWAVAAPLGAAVAVALKALAAPVTA